VARTATAMAVMDAAAMATAGKRRRAWRRWAAAAVFVAVALACAGKARAQDLEPPRHRQGYYLSGGLYGAVTVARENGDTLGPWGGTAFALRLGQLVTRRFGLGLMIEQGGTSGDGQKATVAALGVEASWAIVRNLAVRGGVGVGFMRLQNPSDPFESSTRGVTGTWYSLGLAYDLFLSKTRLTGGFAITPVVAARLVPGGDSSGYVTFFGADFTWWTGLPRNQLDLPPSEAWRTK